ncbi:MAG: hypothetical protein Q9183_007609 [Haloplaca sp. 2 TL-2023]
MHLSTLIALTTLLTTTISTPISSIQETHLITLTRRQEPANINQLLNLASLAGITLPTDPAVLLALGPVAARLQSYLPTSSVLSVLQTAAPPEFISNVVHDPVYAASFESAFAAGSSPSWFLALPSDVKQYLHTYSGYGSVATAVGQLESVTQSVADESEGTATMTGEQSMQTGDMEEATSGSDEEAQAASTSSAEDSTGAGSRPTASLVMALLGVMGVLGLAVGL